METYKNIEIYTHPHFGNSITVEYSNGTKKCFSERNYTERTEFARLDAIRIKNFA